MEPKEDYILVIDADMIFRSPFIPEEMGVSPGVLTRWSVLQGRDSNALSFKYTDFLSLSFQNSLIEQGAVLCWRNLLRPSCSSLVLDLLKRISVSKLCINHCACVRLGGVGLFWLSEGRGE